MNDQDNTQFNFVSHLVRNKSSVDGHEIEHVFYVAGGFGESTEEGDSPQKPGILQIRAPIGIKRLCPWLFR